MAKTVKPKEEATAIVKKRNRDVEITKEKREIYKSLINKK